MPPPLNATTTKYHLPQILQVTTNSNYHCQQIPPPANTTAFWKNAAAMHSTKHGLHAKLRCSRGLQTVPLPQVETAQQKLRVIAVNKTRCAVAAYRKFSPQP